MIYDIGDYRYDDQLLPTRYTPLVGSTPSDIVRYLESHFSGKGFDDMLRADAYYEGKQPLKYMAPALEQELGDRISQLVLNWCRLGADAYENRLDVEFFRYRGDASGDDNLAQIWQANDCDEQSQQGHLESLILGRSYVIVGAGDAPDDAPLITVESPFQVAAVRDPRTRRIVKALKRWDENNYRLGTLYLPDYTLGVIWEKGEWRVTSRDNHNLGGPPVVALVNRPRLLRPDGVSEFHDVIPIADAANKMATDMMVSGEFHAMPRRWAFGLKEDDFVDEAGNPISSWSAIAGRLWSSENKDINVGQFQESDLAVFHNTIKVLAQLASQQLALPPHYLAFTSDNPTSADAIRSSETQLVKRVERKHTFLGGAWEDVMRLVLRIQTGVWDEAARQLETKWRDPSTPTIAQKADAAVKLNQAGIVPIEQTREDMGYTSEQRRRMAEMDAVAASADPVVSAARALTNGGANASAGGQ